MSIACLFGRCRKQKEGFDLQLTPETMPREVAMGPESAKGTIRVSIETPDATPESCYPLTPLHVHLILSTIALCYHNSLSPFFFF